jgi:hypothetical protein
MMIIFYRIAQYSTTKKEVCQQHPKIGSNIIANFMMKKWKSILGDNYIAQI